MSVDYEWRLRLLMAEHGMFKASDLQPRLAEHGIELSASQVWRLVTGRPLDCVRLGQLELGGARRLLR